MQNSTLLAHETGRNFPLQCTGVWLSPVLASGTSLFSAQQQSANILEVHLPWYRFSIAIMSWWNLLRCSSLTSPRFSEKKSKWDSKEWIFTHITSESFVQSQQVLHNILIVHCFVISWDVLANPLKSQPGISFSLIQVFVELFVCHQFPDPINIPSLIFASLTFWNLFLAYSNPQSFHEAQVYVQRGQINFLRKNKRRIDDIFLPWRHWCSFRPRSIYIVILLVPAVPLAQETAVFCVPELHCIPSNSAITSRSPHNFHLNSSYLLRNLSQQ